MMRISSPAPNEPTLDEFRMGDELHARLNLDDGDPFPSLAEALYERLWKRIVNLEFAPGARLSEEALAKELGVSRTPVREALLRLGQVGLVRVSPRRGFAVPTISRADLIELYDLRAALEIYAARRATPLITDDEIAEHHERQHAAHRRSTSLSASAAEEFFRTDLALHNLLHQRGGNRRSARHLADLMGQLSLLSLRAAQAPTSRLAAIAEHRRILEALSARDTTRVASAIETHIEAVKARALEDVEAAVAIAPGEETD